jgi:hypothetical protein
VRRSKALAAVLESAVITDESGNTVDLSALAPAARAELQDAGDQGSPMSGISDDVDEDVDNEAGERE